MATDYARKNLRKCYLGTRTGSVSRAEPRTQRSGVSGWKRRLLRCAACAARREVLRAFGKNDEMAWFFSVQRHFFRTLLVAENDVERQRVIVDFFLLQQRPRQGIKRVLPIS